MTPSTADSKTLPPYVLAALSVAGLAALGCMGGTPECPVVFNALDTSQGGDLVCACTGANTGGAVWGDGVYTTDSAPCAAAMHAGALSGTTGDITMRTAPGCEYYASSTKNGITSSDWGSFGSSFYVPSTTASATCATPPAPPPTATALCPFTFNAIPDLSETTTITCTCDASLVAGSVWGTGIYTQDSSICGAAVHAGAIPASGGSVTAKAAKGCESFTGSVANGISSSDWGSYPSAFFFPSYGAGACP